MRAPERSVVRLIRWRFQCGSCGHEYQSWGLPPDSYYEILVRSPGDDIAFVFPDENQFWNEVGDATRQIAGETGLDRAGWGRAFRHAWSYVMDLSPAGEPYAIDGLAMCPRCGAWPVESGHIHPVVVNEVPARCPTYRTWFVTPAEERGAILRRAVDEYRADPDGVRRCPGRRS